VVINTKVAGFFQENPRAKWILSISGILVLLIILFLWHHYSVRESTDDAQVDGHIVPISARVGGTIVEVRIQENQEVEAGAVLMVLDPTDYKIALAKAQAEYDDAVAEREAASVGVPITSASTASNLSMKQAGLAATQKEVTSANANLASNQAHLREAEANYAKANRDLERMKQLIGKDEISQQQYDATATTADTAAAALESAKAEVAQAEQQVNVAKSHVQQAEAEVRVAETAPQQLQATQARASSAEAKVQRAKALFDQAKLNLQYTIVKAPFRGVVSKKAADIGQVVQIGQPLIAMVSLDDIWVTANFKETQLKKIGPGQPADIEVDTYGGRKYRGHVASISPATGAKFSLLPPENATGNYVKVVQRIPVRIYFDSGQDPDHLLRPGMSVTATVLTNEAADKNVESATKK